ncbi:MAG: family 78 glycoside hydrolase catalytic domain [Clostridia bacterium]|nr:family 78 glycoside hydrolase catalytic domain [Clostridia bacterium]
MSNLNLHPCRLLCEYAASPQRIDTQRPRFSWSAQNLLRGAKQRAYRILVATEPSLLKQEAPDAWDSGKVISAHLLNHAYGGKDLSPATQYYWCVKIWDNRDRESEWSEISNFHTGLMNGGAWGAEWISAANVGIGAAPLLRRDFWIDRPIRRATAYICGLGYYELTVNGRRTDDEVLCPGFTDYTKQVLYNSADVTELLCEGKNTVGVMLGDGWYGNHHWALRDHTERWVSKPKLLFRLEVQFADGTRETALKSETDGWLTAPSPITENNLYDGETYDARLEKAGWDTPEYLPDADWKPAVTAEPPLGKLVAQEMEPIRILQTRSPISVTSPAEGVFVCDFGQNFAGWAKVRLTGARGTSIRFRYAETLYPNGLVNQENLLKAKVTDTYVLRGEGEERYEPRFTYHGFRYLQIEGYEGFLSPADIEGCIVANDVAQIGRFVCGEPLLNRLHQNILWTERSNMHSIPTDCPQRSERMGWLNDVTVRLEEMLYNFRTPLFLAKWERDITDTVDPTNGSIKDTAPALFSRKHDGDPVDTAYLLIPWLLYLQHRDRRVIEEHYSSMVGWLGFLKSRSEGLILTQRETDLGDWASAEAYLVSPENPRSAITPAPLISTCFFYYDAILMAKMAQALGKEDDRKEFLTLANGIKDAFHRTFFDPERKQYAGGSQGSLAFPLYLGMVPESERDAVARHLAEAVRRQNHHPTTGTMTTKYLLEALCDAGYAEEAYRMVTETEYPSWGYMLRNEATTVWERWENSTGGGMNSHNHPMYASVGAWLYRRLAGIQVDEAALGLSHFFIRPIFPKKLLFVDAAWETLTGEIRSYWKKESDRILLRVGVPFGSEATICIPKACIETAITQIGEARGEVWKQGVSPALPDGILSFRETDGCFEIRVGSGDYCFECK